MSDFAIKVENLAKQYRLGKVGTGTLRHDLNRFWHTIRGKEDPYLKIGQSNDRTKKAESEYVWALQDINFEVKKGEVLGIIGKNGAGKSTLLKILSKITAPTTGQITVNGRIASLLEVGTGFHPELSGRENIFLNGAILGMRKWEIQKKFDEIVDFSGVEAYIDTPVKRYSSGMYVRLAFAVAAFLEPEILIVDEVLAVGDAEFQKKCLGRMKDVSNNEGRTVLFVSHNLSAVRQLCTRGLVLENGRQVFYSNSADSVDFYLKQNTTNDSRSIYIKNKIENKDIELISAEIQNENGLVKDEFDLFDDIFINLSIKCNKSVPNLYGYVVIKNRQEELFIESDTYDYLPNILDGLTEGVHNFLLKINKNTLPFGEYVVYLSLTSNNSDLFQVDLPGDILAFSIVDHSTRRGDRRTSKTGFLLKWNSSYAKQ